jgi:hypothetical protein
MIEFKIIRSVEEIREPISKLLAQHYEELTLDRDVMVLAPDWDQYQRLLDQKELAVLAAYFGGQLVGYSVFFIYNNIHYKNNIMAKNDVLFLSRPYRRGRMGINLIKRSEQHLRELGVSKILWHVKCHSDFRPILHRLGYVDEDIMVGKALRNN